MAFAAAGIRTSSAGGLVLGAEENAPIHAKVSGCPSPKLVAMFDGKLSEALVWTRSVDIHPANPTPRMMHAPMLAANGRRRRGRGNARCNGDTPEEILPVQRALP